MGEHIKALIARTRHGADHSPRACQFIVEKGGMFWAGVLGVSGWVLYASLWLGVARRPDTQGFIGDMIGFVLLLCLAFSWRWGMEWLIWRGQRSKGKAGDKARSCSYCSRHG